MSSHRYNSLPKSSDHSPEEAAAYISAADQERYDAWFSGASDGQDQDELYQETMQLRLFNDYNMMKESILNGSVSGGTNERANPKGRQAFYLANEIRKARLELGETDTQSEEYLQLVTAREDKLEAILSRSEEPYRAQSKTSREIDNLSDEEADFIIDFSGGKYDAILESDESRTDTDNQKASGEATKSDQAQPIDASDNTLGAANSETTKPAPKKEYDVNAQRIDMNSILRSAHSEGKGGVTRDEAEAILARLRAALDSYKAQKNSQQPVEPKGGADQSAEVRENESLEEYEARQINSVETLQNVNTEEDDSDIESLQNVNTEQVDGSVVDEIGTLENVNTKEAEDSVETLENVTTTWRSRLADVFNPRNAKENAKKLLHNIVGASSQVDRWSKDKIKEHPKAAVALGVVAIAGIYLVRREMSDGGHTFAAGTHESGGIEDQLADGTSSMDSGFEDAGDTTDNGASVDADTDTVAGENTASKTAETKAIDPTGEIDAMVDSFSIEAKTITKGEGGFTTLNELNVPTAEQERIWEQIGDELTKTGQGDLVYRNELDENRWGWNRSLVLSDKAQRTIADVLRRNQ